MAIGKEKWERAKALYLGGMAWEAIGSKLGLKSTTLSQRASVEGVTRIKREISQIVSQ